MGNMEAALLAIDIFNLQNKHYEYSFEVDSNFFEKFEESLINIGEARIKIDLDKSDTFIELMIAINGSIQLVCDRSLEEFDYPLNINEQLIFKYGEEDIELDDHIYQIARGTESIQLGQFIYEFISLSIPMKKLHPRFATEENDENDESGKLIYSSAADVESNDEDNIASEDVDPRWQKLKELKNNKQ